MRIQPTGGRLDCAKGMGALFMCHSEVDEGSSMKNVGLPYLRKVRHRMSFSMSYSYRASSMLPIQVLQSVSSPCHQLGGEVAS